MDASCGRERRGREPVTRRSASARSRSGSARDAPCGKYFALRQEDDRIMGVAELRGTFGDRLETGWISVGEAAITRRIAPVAVCCSSASVTSRLRACTSSNRRTFSMAITAWSAKVWTRAISYR